MTRLRLDLCVLADIRVGDNAAPCHAAALNALAHAGYRIGVIPVASKAIPADPFSIDPSYVQLFAEGRITRISSDADIDCALALVFDSRVVSARLDTPFRIDATHRVVTVERPRSLANAARVDLERLVFTAEMALGGPVLWAPNSIIARDALESSVPHWPLTDDDWSPVAPNRNAPERTATETARPVVGMARMSQTRSAGLNDALSRSEHLFASPIVSWKIRGGRDVKRPDWPQGGPVQIWPEDRLSLSDFLARIDILANPDVAEDDPCPVETLMALRAGVVPYLPPEYRPTFGGMALYGDTETLPRVAIDFHGDRGFLSDLQATAEFALQNQFSEATFVQTVRDLVGAPRNDAFAPSIHAQRETRVLFYSSNGVGMGHLTRQLAVARRLPNRIKPVFVSHSQAVDVVRDYGFPCEHIPYHTAYGEARAHWNAALTETLSMMFGFYDPSAVVYDGNMPFIGLMSALDRAPELARVWIRRGLWGIDRDIDALERGKAFDLVLEPSEVAPELDDGPTTRFRENVLTVPPVRILDSAELLDRASACATLGLDPSEVNVLIAPGSGNNFDTGSVAEKALTQLKGRHGVGLAVAEWRIAHTKHDVPANVVRLTQYPFSQFHNAFDFAIAAAGYNTFAEHIATALPTIWVPNENAQQDRQILRASFARNMGLGTQLRTTESYHLATQISMMLDPRSRNAMRNRGQAFARRATASNGAAKAARAIEDICLTCHSRLFA